MRYRLSELIPQWKTAVSAQKWATEKRQEIVDAAFAGRTIIDKRELAYELDKLDNFENLYRFVKTLRKLNENYDAIITIDNKGYVSIELRFVIFDDEFAEARRLKNKWDKEHRGFECCCRMDEQVYNVTHERIERTYGKKLVLLDSPKSYPIAVKGGSPLVRSVYVLRIKP